MLASYIIHILVKHMPIAKIHGYLDEGLITVSGVSQHLSLHPPLPRCEERDHMVAFFSSGVFPHFPAIPLTQTWRMQSLAHSPCLGCSNSDMKTHHVFMSIPFYKYILYMYSVLLNTNNEFFFIKIILL